MLNFKQSLKENIINVAIEDGEILGEVDISGENLYSVNRYQDFTGLTSKYEFRCDNNNLFDLTGCPKQTSFFQASQNKLRTLKGIPEIITNGCDIRNNSLTDLKDIHKQLKSCDNHINISFNRITSNILGLMLIKKLSRIYVMIDNTWFDNHKLRLATQIIEANLNHEQGDLLDCQEALITLGHKEYAKL